MKKIFTLIAAAFMAVSANAQTLLTFPADGNANDITLADGGFSVHAISTKGAIDGNSQFFGTASSYEQFETRWKPGGASTDKIKITATTPAKGYLYIYVRSASSSATDRALVVKQNGAQYFNKVIKENADTDYEVFTDDEGKEKKVFPVIELAVEAGTVDIDWTTNGLNFYGFKFIEDATANPADNPNYEPGDNPGGDPVLPPTDAKVWDFTTTTADMLGEGWVADSGVEGRYAYATETAADTYLDLGEIGFSYGAGISVGRSGGKLKENAIRVDLGKQIQINSSTGVFKVTGLAKDDAVKIRFASASPSEERSFTVQNGDKTSITATISEVTTEDGDVVKKADVVEEEIIVAKNGDLTLIQSKGINVKAISINAELPAVTDGIETVKAASSDNAAIYNLAGQQVRSAVKGVYIQNGKKFIVK